eukprot:Platyproteum_vivax@DN5964_c0_g1_i1.p1
MNVNKKDAQKEVLTVSVPKEFAQAYSLGEKLGSGGFGEVWACRCRLSGVVKVVKIIPKIQEGFTAEEVFAEIEIMQKLSHVRSPPRHLKSPPLSPMKNKTPSPRFKFKSPSSLKSPSSTISLPSIILETEETRDMETGDVFPPLLPPRSPYPSPSACMCCEGCEHVVRMSGYFEDDEHYFAILEKLSGGTLTHLVSLPNVLSIGGNEEDVARIMAGVLLAVNECHIKGVVHSDIKADHFIFTDQTKTVMKLIDFGLAYTYDINDPHAHKGKQAMGTLHYVSPEYALGKKEGPWTDIWNVGIMAYLLLYGVYPFQGSDEAITQAVINKEPSFAKPSGLFKRLSKEAVSFIQHLLQKKPSDRPTAPQALTHRWLTTACLDLCCQKRLMKRLQFGRILIG